MMTQGGARRRFSASESAMKNFLILGLLALLLFSISASLSLWLQQQKQTAESAEKEKEKDKEKVLAKSPKGGEPKETTEPRPSPKPEPPPGGAEAKSKSLRDQEERIERRAAQVELVIRDIQTQREATESALHKVTNELKSVNTATTKLDALAEDLRRRQVDFEAAEKKNVEKIAAMYDAMTPEASAPILKEMAEKGRLDMAAKILVLMKERNAARVLEAMNDPALALQVLEKMRGIRAVSPPPVGAAPVVPVGAPANIPPLAPPVVPPLGTPKFP
jgi:flagellar motility protein MotE (MotC chaperone)